MIALTYEQIQCLLDPAIIIAFSILIFSLVEKKPRLASILMIFPALGLIIKYLILGPLDPFMTVMIIINIIFIVSVFFLAAYSKIRIFIFVPIIAGGILWGVYLALNIVLWDALDTLKFLSYFSLYVVYYFAVDRILTFMTFEKLNNMKKTN
ncbi:MAG: hypothetical protein Q8882_07215 [Bacillota bacterium]|nr:hypothetical protein [Bacillota bacterium]